MRRAASDEPDADRTQQHEGNAPPGEERKQMGSTAHNQRHAVHSRRDDSGPRTASGLASDADAGCETAAEGPTTVAAATVRAL